MIYLSTQPIESADSADRSGLYLWDPATDRLVRIGTTSVYLSDIAMAPDGTLYGIGYESFFDDSEGSLYRIDAETAGVDEIGPLIGSSTPFPDNRSYFGANALDISADGVAKAGSFTSSAIVEVDLETGAVSNANDARLPGFEAAAGDIVFDGDAYWVSTGTGSGLLRRIEPVGDVEVADPDPSGVIELGSDIVLGLSPIPDGVATPACSRFLGFAGLDVYAFGAPGVTVADGPLTTLDLDGGVLGAAFVSDASTGGGEQPGAIIGGDRPDSLTGGEASDVINAAGRDVIKTGDGNDEIDGDDDDDVILSGNDDDLVRGGAGNDNIKPGRGNDTVEGGDGDDVVAGFRGDERFDGGDGNDRLLGSVDDDTLIGGPGDDRLWGGPGFDVFVFQDLAFGTDTLPLDVRIGSDTLDFSAIPGLTRADFSFRQVGSNVVAEVEGGGTLIMNGVRFGGLDAEDFEARFDEVVLL